MNINRNRKWGWVCFSLFFLIVASAVPSSAQGEVKIPVPYEAVREKDEKQEERLREIVKQADANLSLREQEIKAPERAVLFFLDRPLLASKILEEYALLGFSVDKAEKGRAIEIVESSGFRSDVEEIGKRKTKRVYLFRYFFRSPAGIGIKFSGQGALLIRHSETGEDEKTTEVDLDVYLKAGDLPLDQAAKWAPILLQWYFQTKMGEYLQRLTDLCEMVAEEPGDVYEEIEDVEEFTQEELGEFRRFFLPQKIARLGAGAK